MLTKIRVLKRFPRGPALSLKRRPSCRRGGGRLAPLGARLALGVLLAANDLTSTHAHSRLQLSQVGVRARHVPASPAGSPRTRAAAHHYLVSSAGMAAHNQSFRQTPAQDMPDDELFLLLSAVDPEAPMSDGVRGLVDELQRRMQVAPAVWIADYERRALAQLAERERDQVLSMVQEQRFHRTEIGDSAFVDDLDNRHFGDLLPLLRARPEDPQLRKAIAALVNHPRAEFAQLHKVHAASPLLGAGSGTPWLNKALRQALGARLDEASTGQLLKLRERPDVLDDPGMTEQIAQRLGDRVQTTEGATEYYEHQIAHGTQDAIDQIIDLSVDTGMISTGRHRFEDIFQTDEQGAPLAGMDEALTASAPMSFVPEPHKQGLEHALRSAMFQGQLQVFPIHVKHQYFARWLDDTSLPEQVRAQARNQLEESFRGLYSDNLTDEEVLDLAHIIPQEGYRELAMDVLAERMAPQLERELLDHWASQPGAVSKTLAQTQHQLAAEGYRGLAERLDELSPKELMSLWQHSPTNLKGEVERRLMEQLDQALDQGPDFP